MTRAGARPIPLPRRDAEIIADADVVLAGGRPAGARGSIDELRGTLEEHGAVLG